MESNIVARDGLSPAVVTALKARSTSLGAEYIVKETGLVPSELTEAEQRIVFAIGEYASILKRLGKIPNRTLQQIRRRGLIDAAEVAVCKSKPTQGYQILADADLEDLSYEQIVLDHPGEFSVRAVWYARRTLGLPNVSYKPPAPTHSDVNTRTGNLLGWLRQRAANERGYILPFENSEAAAAIGLGSLQTFGRVHGNIQSRIDFACYLCDLPPLGCAAVTPFDGAWEQEVVHLQQAAQGRQWFPADFDRILLAANELPGIAHLPWREALLKNQQRVVAWIKRWAKSGTSQFARPADSRHLERLPADVLQCATPEFVWIAVQSFVDGTAAHSFGESTDFDLVLNDQRFPAKAVFGVALSLALAGQKVEPTHFSGGEDSICFRLLRDAGFHIASIDAAETPNSAIQLPDQEWREGTPRLVAHWRRERAAGLAPAKKAQHRRIHGKLTCERCGLDPVQNYGTHLAESCIEVHHAKVLVSEMSSDHLTNLQDLECLCANCHRLAHRLIASA